jgi:hypothetical protein
MKADFNRRSEAACDAGEFKALGGGAMGRHARSRRRVRIALNSLVVRWLVDVQGNIVVLNPVQTKVVRGFARDGTGNGVAEGGQ